MRIRTRGIAGVGHNAGMSKPVLVLCLIVGLIAGLLLVSGPGSKGPDYGAMATPALDAIHRATDDEGRLDAVLLAHDAFCDIVDEIDSPEAARDAKPHLEALAAGAKLLDDRMRERPDARTRLLDRRRAACEARAVRLGLMMTSLAFRPKTMTELLDPIEALTSTLQR